MAITFDMYHRGVDVLPRKLIRDPFALLLRDADVMEISHIEKAANYIFKVRLGEDVRQCSVDRIFLSYTLFSDYIHHHTERLMSDYASLIRPALDRSLPG